MMLQRRNNHEELTRPSSVAKKKDADLRKPPEVKPRSTEHITMMKKWRVSLEPACQRLKERRKRPQLRILFTLILRTVS